MAKSNIRKRSRRRLKLTQQLTYEPKRAVHASVMGLCISARLSRSFTKSLLAICSSTMLPHTSRTLLNRTW